MKFKTMLRIIFSWPGMIVETIVFVILCNVTPYPIPELLLLTAFVFIVLGIVVSIMDAYRNTSRRFWDALERPRPPEPENTNPESDYLPYVEAKKHRRL